MPILRRVCFGEPKPGEQQFAALLQKLDESVSYCNQPGPLQHDRVTDVPFTVPVLGLNFVHPTPLQPVVAPPPADDDWGLFAAHHMQLYYPVGVANLPPLHQECGRLCRAIYAYPGDPPEPWDHQGNTADVVWAVRLENDRAFVVFRGSDDLMDWLRDLTGLDPNVAVTTYAAFGPMWDGFVIGIDKAWAAIKPLVASVSEVVFTGHSLGAARAGVAAGFALAGGGGG